MSGYRAANAGWPWRRVLTGNGWCDNPPEVEFRILGPLEIVDDGRELTLARPKQRALLALLLLRPNRVVAIGELLEVLGELYRVREGDSRLRRPDWLGKAKDEIYARFAEPLTLRLGGATK